MKKNYLLICSCFLLFFCLNKSNAQTPVVRLIDSLSKTITPFYSNRSILQLDTINLRIHIQQNLNNADTVIVFNLNAPSFPNHPTLQHNTFVVPANKRQNNLTLDTFLVLSTTAMVDTLHRDEFGVLRIGNNNEFITLRLSPAGLYDPQKVFWIELGANLDLIDGLEANNLFSGVFLYQKDIRHLIGKNHKTFLVCEKKKDKFLIHKSKSDNLGILAGVYESKAVSTSTSSDFSVDSYYDLHSFTHPSHDSAYIFTDVGQKKTKQEVRNVGLFFSPQVRLSNGSANENGIHFFLSLWAEILWQKISNTYDYSNFQRIDSSTILVSNLSQYQNLNINYSFETYTHYEGFGLPIFLKKDDANLFINPVFGISNQVNSDQLKSNYVSKAKTTNAFYLVQFRLNEEHYGIAFSGEVRALFQKNNQPFITLVLSKKFDLTKLIEYK